MNGFFNFLLENSYKINFYKILYKIKIFINKKPMTPIHPNSLGKHWTHGPKIAFKEYRKETFDRVYLQW